MTAVRLSPPSADQSGPKTTQPSAAAPAPAASAAASQAASSAASHRDTDAGGPAANLPPVAGLTSPAGPAPATVAAFTSPRPAGPTPDALPSPASQLFSVLGPIRNADNGTHSVNLRLQPEGLGNVDAVVTVAPNRIVVELRADTPEARQALSAALPDLRHEMGSSGQQATVFLSDGGAHGSGRQQSYSYGGADGGADSAELDQQIPVAVAHTSSSSSIDLRL